MFIELQVNPRLLALLAKMSCKWKEHHDYSHFCIYSLSSRFLLHYGILAVFLKSNKRST